MPTPINSNTNSLPSLTKLRHLADRALEVFGRHEGTHAAIGAFGTTLLSQCDTYRKAYDAAMITGPTRSAELAEGHEAVSQVRGVSQKWLGLLSRDIEEFDGSSYSVGSDVPDKVMSDGRRLHELVEAHKDQLPYADELLTELGAALEIATKEWKEGQDALAAHQAQRASVRVAAVALQRELVAFRRTVGAVLGRKHRDYQKLKVSRVTTADDEDETTDEVVDTDLAS